MGVPPRRQSLVLQIKASSARNLVVTAPPPKKQHVSRAPNTSSSSSKGGHLSGRSAKSAKSTKSGTSATSAREDNNHDGYSIRIKSPRKSGSFVWPSFAQILHLVHRMLVVVAAVVYVSAGVRGTIGAFKVIQTVENPHLDFAPYTTPLVGKMVGTTTIYESPLMALLDQDTTPRNATLYLDGENGASASLEHCASPTGVDAVYSNTFLRSVYDAIVDGGSYNLTFLDAAHTELIVPVVDCTGSGVEYEDSSIVQVFFLVRNKLASPGQDDSVSLISLILANQGYAVPSRGEKGALGVATLTYFHDLRRQDVEHHFLLSIGFPFERLRFDVYEYVDLTKDCYWVLRSVPRDPTTEVPRVVYTSSRTGFFPKAEEEQSNIKNEYWLLSKNPLEVASTMQWVGIPALRDSWAWVHLFHIYFVADMAMKLLVLSIVIYRNWQKGRFWVGDAFVTISKTLFVRGGVVLVSWYLNKFWSLLEYCYAVGNSISEVEMVFIHPEIMHADLMVLFLTGVGLMAKLARERMDPAMSIVLFELAFWGTPTIIRWFPAFVAVLNDRTLSDYQLGVIETEEDLSIISPMRLWNAHQMREKDVTFIAAALAPILLLFVPVCVYIAGMKLWRRRAGGRRSNDSVRPLVLGSQRHQENSSASEASSRDEPKGPRVRERANSTAASRAMNRLGRTQFESATGVILEKQYGLLTNYESCRMIKGMKFASADGIYTNGFVIANGRFLVATDDVFVIMVSKALRIRIRNIYVYTVEGHSVQETARLVFPSTMTWRDLLHLNISTLQ